MYFSPKYWPWNTVLSRDKLTVHQIAEGEAKQAIEGIPKGDERVFEFRRVYDLTCESLEGKSLEKVLRG